jgi:Kef-type K+ transport system membrane component KefB
MEDALEAMKHLPLMARFAILMVVILAIPPLFKRIRLPGVVGLLAFGVLFGPSGLEMAPQRATTAHDLSEIGKLLLMFFAGMEIDLAQFRRVRRKSLSFGVLTFALPLLAGVAIALGFGYGWVAAFLIGSLLASHTLLGFPIVQELGLLQKEAVAVTIGATVFTDIAALLVLAICVPIHVSGFAPGPFIGQIVMLAVFIPLVLLGLGWLGRFLMAKTTSKEGQFCVLLLVVALAAIGAEVIHLEGIIGAFLAGLAVNRAAQGTQAKEELEFIGNAFFIPIFFITIGFLIDLGVFFRTLVEHFALMASIVGGLILAKFAAAAIAARRFGYTSTEANLMWSLSLPQVAATLAAALVAYEAKNAQGQRLIDEPVLNIVIVLMVVTAVLGPVLTERFGRRLATAQTPVPEAAATPSRDSALVAETRAADRPEALME